MADVFAKGVAPYAEALHDGTGEETRCDGPR
ncbi:hypothetical protein MCHLDSM_05474 [Mycolicibacterium chlorophenolicum]|uniref:Uncharacterized protein n=1 Tax=Mycolicibacterium chlorophenolicum TaxID=37916 RepID=A0A0J6VM24_9MYCO|nr:hypothetical protein MCHLDSM_05474 [Mycolicibacterium chlorophenolicum]